MQFFLGNIFPNSICANYLFIWQLLGELNKLADPTDDLFPAKKIKATMQSPMAADMELLGKHKVCIILPPWPFCFSENFAFSL